MTGNAVDDGSAAKKPWQHYDLGHGWCSYSFFEQCPHRMACADCDFYIPKRLHKSPTFRGKRKPATYASPPSR